MELILLSLVCLFSTALGFISRQPHIILILGDDLGFNDVGWHNPAVKTPHMNWLAYNGIRFNQSYALPTDSPSRAALLTGMYPHNIGLQHATISAAQPIGLPVDYMLLPEKLKTLGYSTHIVGKWHLGFCKWDYTPTRRGFDSFFGFYTGSEDYFTHRHTHEVLGTKFDGYDFRFNEQVYTDQEETYSTHAFAARAADIIKNHNKSAPLFLYLPFQAAHAPFQVPKQYENLYPGLMDDRRRTFSALVSALDEAIGNVTNALSEEGMLEDSLIVFMSTNGGMPSLGGNNYPFRGAKTTLWEGGTRVPAFVYGSMLKGKNTVRESMFHVTDWFPTLTTAAGGTVTHNINGVDQWLSLVNGLPSTRNEIVYNIDDILENAAIRVGDYKLIVGNPGNYNGVYKPINEVEEQKPFSLWKDTLYLYNVKTDPQESNDLAGSLPKVTELLYARLLEWKKTMLPSKFPAPDSRSDPRYFGGNWSPGWC